MLRTIGMVMSLVFLLVACGGGGGTSGGGTGGTSSPPPPPPINGYTVGGTVSGLVGSGLALAICRYHSRAYARGYYVCDSPLQVNANGAFTLGGAYPAMYSGPDIVEVTQQPAWPQQCVVGNATINIQDANDTGITVSCAEYSYVTNAADNTLSAYTLDATTGALGRQRHESSGE
jgi:6-phosphogluconolactonase